MLMGPHHEGFRVRVLFLWVEARSVMDVPSRVVTHVVVGGMLLLTRNFLG